MAKKKVAKKKYTHYHKDGTVCAKGYIKGGKMEGYWEWFRKPPRSKGRLRGTISQNRMRSGNFKNGKQVGKWVTYDKNGRAVKVTQMK